MNRYIGMLTVLLLMACNTTPSLQKYYVAHQNDDNFIVVDVPASLFLVPTEETSSADKKTMGSIEKANILAFPIHAENEQTYRQEREKLTEILSQESYKTLMRFNVDGKEVEALYLGDEKAIDELVVFGNDPTKGFIVARILGENMRPKAMMKLMNSLKEENINLQGLQKIGKSFATE